MCQWPHHLEICLLKQEHSSPKGPEVLHIINNQINHTLRTLLQFIILSKETMKTRGKNPEESREAQGLFLRWINYHLILGVSVNNSEGLDVAGTKPFTLRFQFQMHTRLLNTVPIWWVLFGLNSLGSHLRQLEGPIQNQGSFFREGHGESITASSVLRENLFEWQELRPGNCTDISLVWSGTQMLPCTKVVFTLW